MKKIISRKPVNFSRNFGETSLDQPSIKSVMNSKQRFQQTLFYTSGTGEDSVRKHHFYYFPVKVFFFLS